MPEAADIVANADVLLEAKLFDEAVSSYTKAIELIQSPNYFIKRSTAYQRAGKYEEALKDAEEAITLAKERGKADLIATAQIRKAISLHGLKKFKESNEMLQFVKKRGSKDKTIDLWLAKNNMELKKLENTSQSAAVEEKPKQEKSSPVAKDTTEKPKEPTKTVTEPTKPTQEPPAPAPVPKPQAVPPQRIRHEWYQTDQFVFVDMFYKNIPKDKCTVEFEPTSVTVTFPLPTGSDFTFVLDPLSNPIDPSQSTSQVLSTKLSLRLAKKSRGTKWAALEAVQQAAAAPSKSQSTPTTIAYPTSSRKGTKNWDALEREAIEDAKDWEKPDGDAAANALFRDLYANASDDVKRAMIKSYVESNGTALSTDWSNVGKKKVETKPPDSMVAKKWDE